ncbi:MAG: Hpt domain-containing protein [Vicinamibacterales bacterium]
MATALRTLAVDQLEELRVLQEEGQPDVLSEMVGLFIDEAEARLLEATEAARTGDVVVLHRSAHSLRGACGAVGAEQMCALAAELEAAGQPHEASPIVQALVAEFWRVRELLGPYQSIQVDEEHAGLPDSERTGL